MDRNTIEAAAVLINEAEGYLMLGKISKGKQSLARGKAILETIIGGVKQPATPETEWTKGVGISDLLAAGRPDQCVSGWKSHDYEIGDDAGKCKRCGKTTGEIYKLKGERARRMQKAKAANAPLQASGANDNQKTK